MKAQTTPRVHPDFKLDGLYLYVELLSRMSRRGWLLVNLIKLKRDPERAGFTRVRAIVGISTRDSGYVSTVDVGAEGEEGDATGKNADDVEEKEDSETLDLIFPALPERLRSSYLPNAPLKTNEGMENFMEEYSGAMVYLTTREVEDEDGEIRTLEGVVELWYPGGWREERLRTG